MEQISRINEILNKHKEKNEDIILYNVLEQPTLIAEDRLFQVFCRIVEDRYEIKFEGSINDTKDKFEFVKRIKTLDDSK